MIKRIKHEIKKILGIKDYWWYQSNFEEIINTKTIINREDVINWANEAILNKETNESEDKYLNSSDAIVRQGCELRNKVLKEFKDKLSEFSSERILIHIPDWRVSPAGYSLFNNMKDSFDYLGIPVDELGWNEDVSTALERFKPTILLSGDHKTYLDKINWSKINEYRLKNILKIGLTASLEEYGNSPLIERLNWAKNNNIDFYYSFREEDYINSRKEYKPFFENGYVIFSIPFGANPLIHYPVPNIKKDLDYVFIASVNKTKSIRYLEYMKIIVKDYFGFIDGPGWKHTSDFSFNRNRDRYIFSRSKVGLNIHLEEQILWANETSERTYQLAACGVPQVTDNAKILNKLFSSNSLFIANRPDEYLSHFKYIQGNPKSAEAFALIAQKEVFEKYTTFHRAEKFAILLFNYLNKK